MKGRATRWLKILEQNKSQFGDGAGRRKLELLRALDKARFRRSKDLIRLHDTLCFLRAYPDDAKLLAKVEGMLESFPKRSDLRRFRARLVNSGIAGTEIHFPFFPATASWLARRWGKALTIDWEGLEDAKILEDFVPQLGLYSETLSFDNFDFSFQEWVDRLKGPAETDAEFFLRRLEQVEMGHQAREAFLEHVDIPFRLAPGADTPARGREKLAGLPVAYQSTPLVRSRVSLAEAAAVAPVTLRTLPERRGRQVIDLVRRAMVARERDLDAFCFADPKDITLIDRGGGVRVACIGVAPERRFLLESLYGFVVLRNGVPIGYGTYTALFNSAEVAFTVFDAFRSGEAARIYAQVLAIGAQLFQCDAFTVHPNQIGQDNEDAIRSGAWWFYQKMGFRPRSAQLLRLMRREERRMKAKPKYRSSPATLRELSSEYIGFHLGRPRPDVLGFLPLEEVGLKITEYLGGRFGHDRARGEATCAREAANRLGVRLQQLADDERLAWERWSPLVLILPGLERWSPEDKRSLVAVVRAKGGRSELEYLRRFNGHRRLRKAILTLAGR